MSVRRFAYSMAVALFALTLVEFPVASPATASGEVGGRLGALTTTTAAVSDAQRIDIVKEKCAQAITRRVEELNRLKVLINKSTTVKPEHKAALIAETDGYIRGLETLKTRIAALTTFQEILTEARKIVADYRAYVLEVPKVHLILAVDGIELALTKLQALSEQLQTQIDAWKASGKDTANAEAQLRALNEKIAAVKTSLNGVPDELLALTPSGYPDNRATLQSTRQKIKDIRQSLKQARDGGDVAIKAAKP